MPRLNWSRIIIGGLIAAIILFLTDGFLHERIVSAYWKAIYAALGANEPQHSAGGIAYFAIFELGRGVISILIYALMRPFFKPGPKTAVLAGIVTWLAFSVTGPAQFIPLMFYSNALWVKVGAFQLVTSIVAAIAGAAIYKDSAAA
ncbi:MAG TPA: hypothetical protein VJS64_11035 [Pyrinomonadaceae bacterium]|nr:hypothetical protein [Pyrinomonadaceae bacterium]